MKFILPNGANANHLQGLKKLGIGNNNLVFHDGNQPLKVERLYFVPRPAPNLHERPSSLRWLKKMLSAGHQSGSEKIYISRKFAPTRHVKNEDELCGNLKSIGFQVVYCENLCFDDQIELFERTKLVVAPHGAGLVNTIFMPEGGVVVELFPEEIQFRTYFYTIGKVMGHKYYYVKSPSSNESAWGDIVVDIKKLNAVLDKIL